MSVNQAPRTLLSLPAEVKQNILSYLLCAEEPFAIYNARRIRKSHIEIQVLYTCHDLYGHGRLVLYRQNWFSITRLSNDEDHWLAKLSSQNVASLSRVETSINSHGDNFQNAMHFHQRRAESAELVQRYIEVLALLRVPITPSTGLRHLRVECDYLSDPVDLATLMRALVTIPQLLTLELKLAAVPMVWALYLNQRLRIPVSFRSTRFFYWDPIKMFKRLEHSMRLCKRFEVQPADKLPEDWVNSDAYRAIVVPTFTDNDWQVPVIDPNHYGTFYDFIGWDWWTGIVHEPHKFRPTSDLPTSDVPTHTLSSVLSGVESRMAEEDLVSGRYTASEYHAKEYELVSQQHGYLQSVWNEFKGMGLLERKAAQGHEDRVIDGSIRSSASLVNIMRSYRSQSASQFIGLGYDDIVPSG
jgi:hypothetical protein